VRVRAAEPEPAGGARSRAERHRVRGESEGRAGDRPPAREVGPPARGAARPSVDAGEVREDPGQDPDAESGRLRGGGQSMSIRFEHALVVAPGAAQIFAILYALWAS